MCAAASRATWRIYSQLRRSCGAGTSVVGTLVSKQDIRKSLQRLRHLRYLVHLEGQREGTVPKCRGCQQRSTSGASCSSRGWLPWPSTSSCTSATGCPGRRRLSSAYPLLVVSRFLRLLVSHFLRHLLSPLPTHLPSRPPIHLLGLRLLSNSRRRLLSSSSIYKIRVFFPGRGNGPCPSHSQRGRSP